MKFVVHQLAILTLTSLIATARSNSPCWAVCNAPTAGQYFFCTKDDACSGCPMETTCPLLCDHCSGPDNVYGGLSCDCDPGIETTAAPITAAPTTPAPIYEAPVTPVPITPAPIYEDPGSTAAPVTAAPITPAPITQAPVYEDPGSTAAPITAAPITPEPTPTTAPYTPPSTPAPTPRYKERCVNSCRAESRKTHVCQRTDGACALCPVEETCEKLCRRCKGRAQDFGSLNCDCGAPDAPTDAPTIAPTIAPTAPIPNVTPTVNELSLTGFDPNTFNDAFGPLCFLAQGTEFDTSSDESILLTINDVETEVSTILASEICYDTDLSNGRNSVVFTAGLMNGIVVDFQEEIWVGAAELTATIFENGVQVAEEVTVTASLSDNPKVTTTQTTTSGQVVFKNLPERTIVLTAESISGTTGSSGGVPMAGSNELVINLIGLVPVSPPNLEFSNGLEGWVDAGGTGGTVELIPHTELVGPSAQEERRVLQDVTQDNDLLLETGGLGPVARSHAFETSEATQAVVIRYRFITSEVPGGFFGTEFNDYFRVSLRSVNAGEQSEEANTMNGLGLSAFNFADGSTDWRYVTLPVRDEGDIVQVDLEVANVADGLFASQVVVDVIEEVQEKFVCIYSNAGPGAGFTAGHAALLYANTENESVDVTTYGLWPDSHPVVPDNGAGSDIRVNLQQDNPSGYVYFYCEAVSENQKQLLDSIVSAGMTWLCTNNCASFASETFFKITGTDVDADEILGFETPREIGESILLLNGGSTTPPGGLPFAPTGQRFLQTFDDSIISSIPDSCSG